MGKSIRIRTTPNGEDKFIKVNLEQDFDEFIPWEVNISKGSDCSVGINELLDYEG